MNRRSFLGWFGASAGTLAIYKELPSSGLTARDAMIEEHSREAKSAECPSNQFVIKNESERPYVVHYRRELHPPATKDEYLAGTTPIPAFGHSTTLLLPGEELTITAVEMQV